MLRRRTFCASSLAVAVAGCSKTRVEGMVLNRGNSGEPSSLDPHHIQGTWESSIVGDMLVGLTTDDAAARPIPGAATHWEVSPDGKTWTFHMRKHVWSDGMPVTAHDFVFAWRRLMDPKNAALYAYNLWVVKNAEAISGGRLPPSALGIAAPDPATLVVTLEHPAPYLLELLTHETAYPVPRHVVEKAGDQWTRPEHIVSNGPYVLREWVPNDHIALVKNPRFYDAHRVRIDTVYFYPTMDSEAALKRFRAGQLDTQNPLPATEIDWIRANMPKALDLHPYLGVAYVMANYRRAPFADARVRRAINLAYGRELITDRILRLGERPAYGIVPPGTANYPGGAALPFRSMPPGARLAKARALMSQAGYGPARRLKTTYSTDTSPDSRRIATATQAMMRDIHIDLEIVQSELQILFARLRAHDFDLAGASWIADFDDASNFLDLLRSGSGNNYGGYANPAYDALLDKAQNLTDLAARGQLLVQAEQMALNDDAWIPMRFMVTRNLVEPYVKGWTPNAQNRNRTRWLRIEGRPRR